VPCYWIKQADGSILHIHGRLGPHCSLCAGVGDHLCDFPVGDDKTCDRRMCESHALHWWRLTLITAQLIWRSGKRSRQKAE
jgi:hypothetical protein